MNIEKLVTDLAKNTRNGCSSSRIAVVDVFARELRSAHENATYIANEDTENAVAIVYNHRTGDTLANVTGVFTQGTMAIDVLPSLVQATLVSYACAFREHAAQKGYAVGVQYPEETVKSEHSFSLV